MLHDWLFIRLFIIQKSYKLIEIKLTKKQALDVDPKAMRQASLNIYLERDGITAIFLNYKKNILHFF